jgi:hypothetical protein
MIRPLPLIAGILGVVCLALAAYYWVTPAGDLAPFLPGFEAGVQTVHVKHALGALVIGIALLAVAWLQSRPREFE